MNKMTELLFGLFFILILITAGLFAFRFNRFAVSGVALAFGLFCVFAFRDFNRSTFIFSNSDFYPVAVGIALFYLAVMALVMWRFYAVGNTGIALELRWGLLYAGTVFLLFHLIIVSDSLKKITDANRERQTSNQIEKLSQNIADNPDDWKLYIQRAEIYGDYSEEGLADLKKAHSLNSDDYDLNARLCSMLGFQEEGKLYCRKMDELDMERLNRQISRKPDPQDLYFRAILHQKRSDTTQAIADYEQALELDPQMYLACYTLGDFYFLKGETARSDQFYRRGATIYWQELSGTTTPNLEYYIFKEKASHKRDLCRENKNPRFIKAALADYLQALKLSPDEKDEKYMMEQIADLYRQSGDSAQAEIYRKRVEAMN
jgi:tetratricopeptide (TPR) repeat protein